MGTAVESGVVVEFDAAKGFGFVRSGSYPEDVFVHISAVRGGAALRPGQRVRFHARRDAKGPRAEWVEPGRRGLLDLAPGHLGAVAVGLVVIGGTCAIQFVHPLPWPVAWVLALSVATFGVFAFDKRRARRDGRRVPELALHGMTLAGGTPGALLAMALLRHKSRKNSFRLVTAAIVVVQLLALGTWLGTASSQAP